MIWMITLGALLVMATFWKLAVGHHGQFASVVQCQQVWRNVDLQAAAALFNESDDAYLQERLSFLAWYKVKCFKTVAAWHYLSDISFNARLMTLIAQFNIQEHRESSLVYQQLVTDAVRLRGHLFAMKTKLVLALIIPGLTPQAASAFTSYAALQTKAVVQAA